MINIDFTDFTNTKPARTSGEKSKVKYFSSLKDDGDETVVRLDYDSPKDFKDFNFIMILDHLEIPGNIGTIYRTLDSCKCEGVNTFKVRASEKMVHIIYDKEHSVLAAIKRSFIK